MLFFCNSQIVDPCNRTGFGPEADFRRVFEGVVGRRDLQFTAIIPLELIACPFHAQGSPLVWHEGEPAVAIVDTAGATVVYLGVDPRNRITGPVRLAEEGPGRLIDFACNRSDLYATSRILEAALIENDHPSATAFIIGRSSDRHIRLKASAYDLTNGA